MKNYLFTVLLTLFAICGFSQSDENSSTNLNQLKSPELINLYEQSRVLEKSNASAEAIEDNRLAIKNAWTQVNPEIGNLYKPINNEGLYPDLPEYLHLNGAHVPAEIKQRDEEVQFKNSWADDIQVFSGFVDGGVDVVVDDNGDIYTSHFQNNIDFGGANDIIFVHRSTDNGDTWSEYAAVDITSPVRQLQLVSIHGTGDNYLLAYFVTDSKTFQVLRWNTTAGGSLSVEAIVGDVVEFAVDRNYPVNTDGQRVFGVFKDEAGALVRSARSTAGSFGFDWVDEFEVSFGVNSLDLAYGRDGSNYVVGIGNGSLNLRVKVNTNYNDPASWEVGSSTLESSVDRETLNPTIIAGREILANDNVFVFASSRVAGSTGNYDGYYYRRENAGAFSTGITFNSGGSNFNILNPDSFIRFENGTTTARLSYVREVIDNSANNENRSITYDGSVLDPFEPVADSSVDVFAGFKSATAELPSTNEPVLVFAGSNGGGTFGQDLFFDKQSAVLNTTEFDLSNILVYPNPVSGNLLIKSPKKTMEQIKVFNYLGQVVMKKSPNTLETKIDMGIFKNGIYLIQISAEGSLETHKVIKK